MTKFKVYSTKRNGFIIINNFTYTILYTTKNKFKNKLLLYSTGSVVSMTHKTMYFSNK